MDVLGIDVSKADLSVVLLQGDTTARKKVNNSTAGFKQLSAWLRNRKVQDLHACLEATGVYGEAIAEYLVDHEYRVSVVNPAQIKAYGRSALVRTKTDGVDALIIAQFCRAHRPPAWSPPPENVRNFRALLRRREALVDMITAEGNRLEAACGKAVRRSIKAVLSALKHELAALERDIDKEIKSDPALRDTVGRLDEIPGIGPLTAMKIIAETQSFRVCRSAPELVAYAGLNPKHYQSGPVHRRQSISKIGNAALRKALFYAAMAAKNRSGYFRSFVERLKAAGKPPKVIITAIMRKLLVLAHTLVSRGTRFNAAMAT